MKKYLIREIVKKESGESFNIYIGRFKVESDNLDDVKVRSYSFKIKSEAEEERKNLAESTYRVDNPKYADSLIIYDLIEIEVAD